MGTAAERELVWYIRPSKVTRCIASLRLIIASRAESPAVKSSLVFAITIRHAKRAWLIQATIACLADVIHTSNAASL